MERSASTHYAKCEYTHFAKQRLRLGSPFSYACHRCSRCCRCFSIALTPFDLLLLADSLGISTTETIAQHLDGTNRLQRRKDGACKFLMESGCAVHGGRPLVCRMYPLARNVAPAEEWFSVLEPVAGSEAEWGVAGTVSDYLADQEAMPSIEGYDLYSRLHHRLALRVKALTADIAAGGRAAIESLNLGFVAGGVLDPDPTIQGYCRHHNLPEPISLRHRAACHVQAIEEWVEHKLGEIRS